MSPPETDNGCGLQLIDGIEPFLEDECAPRGSDIYDCSPDYGKFDQPDEEYLGNRMGDQAKVAGVWVVAVVGVWLWWWL